MRVCYFGTYTMEECYPRNRVIIEGLRKNGVEVIECHAELWKGTSEKIEGITDWFSVFRQSARILRTYLNLIKQYRRVGNYDVLIVGYAGHIDIFLAKILNLFRKKPLIFDAFLSLYDTAVMDRKIVSRNSLKARLLWQVDRWACRVADAVLLDTQAHVDYFVREFRLPPEKFFAVPVGSSMKTQGNPPISQIPLFPPLLKGEIGGFTVLYFGSYIPLHGVDVILKAAKIVQENKDNPPTPPLEKVSKGGFEHELSDKKEIVFTLVGTGQLLSEMKKLASGLELKNVIFIDRFVSEAELVGYIQHADICLGVFGQTEKALRVIPCKVYNALALGKPLITAMTPATEGVLAHMDNAFLCRPGDPEDLAKAILRLKNNSSLRGKIALCGQEYYRNNFSSEAIGKRVRDIIYTAAKR